MTDATLVPENEEQRLSAIRRYEILDTPPDGAFDRLTALAARFFRVPIATISIVDRDRIWFKSRHGIDADEIGRDAGLCASAILHEGPWLVTDAATDPRALENPLVRGELGLRFYLGVPLTTGDGYSLGTINVIDSTPREVSDEEVATLEELAAIAVDELELRLAALREERRLGRVRAATLTEALHELRASLSAMNSVARALRAGEGAERSSADLSSVIEDQAERVSRTIDRLLVDVDAESRRPRIVREPYDPAWIARRAIASARRGDSDDVSVDLEVPEAGPLLDAEPDKVRQILANIVDNAIRHSPAGGRVTVSIDADRDRVRFSVRDDGPGIPEHEQERIFERFHHLDPQTGTVGGAGLGLYVARELATELGGRIVLESVPGEGSTFTLELPAGRRAAPERAR